MIRWRKICLRSNLALPMPLSERRAKAGRLNNLTCRRFPGSRLWRVRRVLSRRCSDFEAKPIEPIQRLTSTVRPYRRGSCVGFWVIAYAVALSRIDYALPYKTLRLQGCGFRSRPARATLTPYAVTLRSTTDSAPSPFCTRSVCPICLEGEATLAHLQRVRHSAPSPDVSFLCPYSLWFGDSSRGSYWKPSAKGACAHGPRGGKPPSHKGGIEHGRQS